MALDQARSAAPEVLVAVARGDGPLQRQVEDQLRAAIRSGRLVAGERLPSSRALAADLAVSRGVVSDAYLQLAAEGWLDVRSRSAPRVASAPGVAGAAPAAVAAADPVAFDLRPGRPDLGRFPRADWLRSLGAAVRGASDAELGYPPPEGVLALRSVLVAYRGRVRGTVASPEAVVVTAGAAQAFITIADALGPGRIAVEDPGHADIRAALARRGLEPVPVPVDEEGLVVAALPGDVRAVLVTPAHQFPTGVVLSPRRRAALLAWADAHGALIVEDDYDAEYRYDRAPVGALQGLRPDLVAHVGSVSKTLAPALRLGWLIAPPAWTARMVAARAGLDHGMPALEQLALTDFLKRGAYDRHIRRSGRAYRRRRDALVTALGEAVPSARVSGAAAGLHLTLTVPGVDEGGLVRACRAAGIELDGMARHGSSAADGVDATLLLSFAAVPDAAAPRVARLIAGAVASTSLEGR